MRHCASAPTELTLVYCAVAFAPLSVRCVQLLTNMLLPEDGVWVHIHERVHERTDRRPTAARAFLLQFSHLDPVGELT